MMWSVFDGETYSDYQACQTAVNNGASDVCYGANGSEVLNAIGKTWADNQIGRSIGVLIALAVALRLAAYWIIKRRLQ